MARDRTDRDRTDPVSVEVRRLAESPEAVDAVRAVARLSRMLERSSDELTLAQYRVLSAIASGDHRASRVSAKLALGKPTVSATVDSLCRLGLVTRVPTEDDQRVVALHLTGSGRALLARVERAMTGRIADMCARTPDGDGTMGVLASLGRAMDESLSERGSADRGRRR